MSTESFTGPSVTPIASSICSGSDGASGCAGTPAFGARVRWWEIGSRPNSPQAVLTVARWRSVGILGSVEL